MTRAPRLGFLAPYALCFASAALASGCLALNEDYFANRSATGTASPLGSGGGSGGGGGGGGSDQDLNTDGTGTATSTGPDTSDTTPPSVSLPPSSIPIKIETLNIPRTAPAGYSIQLSIDHAAMVAQQNAAPDGSDLAVIHIREGAVQGVHRVLDPASAWDQSATKIWFPLQEPMAPDLVVQDRYYLVVGASTELVLQEPNEVFVFHNDFDGREQDRGDWTEQLRTIGEGEIFTTDHDHYRTLGVQARFLSSSNKHASYVSVLQQRYDGVEARARMRVPASHNRSCNTSMPLVLESSDGLPRAGLAVVDRELHQIITVAATNTEVLATLPSRPSVSSEWHEFRLSWEQDLVLGWIDEDLLLHSQRTEGVMRPSEQPIGLSIGVSAQGPQCDTSIDRTELDMDWVLLRHFMQVEPAASLVL